MSLVLTRLEVADFRSYPSYTLELDPQLTLVVGPNAVGKTNLLEAIQLLSTAESFKHPQWAELVRWGAEKAQLSMEAHGDGRDLEVSLSVTEAGRREYRVNGKIRRRLVDVAGVIPCIVFTPDDLRLVKDAAEKRRSALDAVGAQLSPSYSRMKAEYERVVRQRNALLRDDAFSERELAPWTELLVDAGARFFSARGRLFDRINAAMGEAHRGVSEGTALEARYMASWERDGSTGQAEDPATEIQKHLDRKKAEERARRTTLVGPHRDDVVFLLEGKDARTFGSQGQQRTIALAWELGEVRVATEVSGQPPVLLLDDVMSELDEHRRHALTRYVGTAAQTVVTTTNLGYFDEDLLARAKVVELS